MEGVVEMVLPIQVLQASLDIAQNLAVEAVLVDMMVLIMLVLLEALAEVVHINQELAEQEIHLL